MSSDAPTPAVTENVVSRDDGTGSSNDRSRLSTLKQERSRKTKAKLVEVALRLWGDRGFDETSVDELCEEARVAKGTFYFYFRAKEDLLIELGFGAVEGMIEEVHRAIDADKTTRQVLDRAIAGLASEAGRTSKPLLERTIEEIFHSFGKRWQQARTGRPHFREILVHVIRRGQERKEVDDRYQAEEIAGIMGLVLLQGLLDWSRDDTDSQALAATLRRRTKLVLEEALLGQ